MVDNSQKTVTSPTIVAKAGLWYTVCNFVFKALAFLTTPFFSRYMSKTELGGFSDFASVASIMIVITSFDLSQSIIRSKAEHEKDMDSYIWSILSLSTIWTFFVYAVFLIFPGFFSNLLKMEWKHIHLLFWYLLAAPPYTMLITKQRAYYQYKRFVLLTGIMAVSGTAMAFLLVLLMQDKLAGRLIGFYSPHILFGAAIFFYLVYKGKKIKIAYWKYASKICIPLVPNDLAIHILGVSDVLLITRLCGQEYTAYYSIAYSAYHIASAFFSAMNKAWAPWLIESLHKQNHAQVRKVSKIYISVFVYIIIGILLLVPEIIMILGGKQYTRSIYSLPPLVTSCAFLFVFTMYVNIEFYEKKTIGVSLATMCGVTVNIVLNLLLLPTNPENSFIIAAYTTMAGYACLFVIHYFIVRHMKMDHVYDTKFVVAVLFAVTLISLCMNLLYKTIAVRWIIIAIYGATTLYLLVRYKEQLSKVLLKKR